MTEKSVQKNNLYMACTSCGENVHSRSKACKKCGTPSPWLAKRGDSAVSSIVVKSPVIEAPVAGFKPHIVLKDFSQVVDNVMVNLKAKRVITDQNLIKRLVAAGAPIMEVGTETDVCVCPACKHIFTNGKSGSSAAQ